MIAINATPPTTPPAIAPTFGPELDEDGLGFFTQTIDAHALQSAGTREQISFFLHGGHVGLSLSGQLTQRLKTVLRVRSISEETLIDRRVTDMSETDMLQGRSLVVVVICVVWCVKSRASRARRRPYSGSIVVS